MSNARAIMAKNNRADNVIEVQRVPATDRQRQMLQEAMRDLIAGYPFLASVASSDSVHYHTVDTDLFPVAATDGNAIYFNTRQDPKSPGYFDQRWSSDNRQFVLGHEVLHILREDVLWMHTHRTLGWVPVPRTPACPDGRLPYDETIYAEANDASINAALIADRCGVMPENGITHPSVTPEMDRGTVYAIMYREAKNNPQKNQGKKPDPMAGDQRRPGSMGQPDKKGEGSSTPTNEAQAAQALKNGTAERQVMAQRAANAARQAGVGTTKAEQMTTAARAPGVDWRSYVPGFLARSAGNSAYTFTRPARPPLVRELLGDEPYYSPARGGNGAKHVVFIGDTSGSIQEAEHRAMLACVNEMVAEVNPRIFTVIWCDSDVQRVDTFESVSGDEVEDFYRRTPIPRGGGTDFRPPFEMLDRNVVKGDSGWPSGVSDGAAGMMIHGGVPDAVMYFTDLYGAAPAEKPDYPVLWLKTTDKEHPWGECVRVDPAELLE